MKSVFRIYAKTSKGNDSYLYNELLCLGLKPKYEDVLHGFYFNANFQDIFKLSFNTYTLENMYVQLGHKFPLSFSTGHGRDSHEKLVGDFFKKINFRNYLPMQRGLVENITLNVLVRESSHHLPSENAIGSILENHLRKEIVLKEYRSMFASEDEGKRLENYYDIKHIVDKKWEHEDFKREEMELLIEDQQKQSLPLIGSSKQKLETKHQEEEEFKEIALPYSPHFVLFIRRNHARLLLKLNKESMHKFGWKKNVGWGPIRETLTASILYRSGILENFQEKKSINLWDPFCGSGTIPLVALSMAKSLRVRKNIENNFIWQNWPVFNPSYLSDFILKSEENGKKINTNIFGSDIDISTVRNSVENFTKMLEEDKTLLSSDEKKEDFLQIKPSDKIFEVIPNSVYMGCGDFEEMASKVCLDKNKKINIITNLPYLGERSKEHIPIKQLNSIYKRFNSMVEKYNEFIENVFVIVDAETNNSNHFIKLSTQEWRILEHFKNGGIEICLLGWAKNTCGWKNTQISESKTENKGMIAYGERKSEYLEEYRSEIKEIENKQYDLLPHMVKSKGLRSVRRVREKKKERHLRAAYKIFAKKRDKDIVFAKYARKNLALRLSQRGKTYKRKNTALINGEVLKHEEVIKKEFETRIEEAMKRSEEMKERQKGAGVKHKKW